MKKFIFIAIFGLITMFVQAQMATVTIPTGQTYISYGTDHTITNTTATYLVVKAAQHVPTTQDVLVQLSGATASVTNVAVSLYGRKFDTSAWTAIGSAVNWKTTTDDTTIVISNATANRYRDFKINYVGTGTGTTTIGLQQIKLYLEN